MEGLLCRWALTLQEYSFTIVYRKGVLNGNADSLSRCENVSTAATFCSIGIPLHTLQEAQRNDPVTSTVYNHLSVSREKPTDKKWSKQPLCRYAQLWSQLLLLDGIVCRRYCPGPDSELITVPVLPAHYNRLHYTKPTMHLVLAIKDKKKLYKDYALMRIGWVWPVMSTNTVRTVLFVSKPS